MRTEIDVTIGPQDLLTLDIVHEFATGDVCVGVATQFDQHGGNRCIFRCNGEIAIQETAVDLGGEERKTLAGLPAFAKSDLLTFWVGEKRQLPLGTHGEPSEHRDSVLVGGGA